MFKKHFTWIILAAILMAVISLPPSIKAKLPEARLSKWLQSQKVTLGLDLQGGTQLDYKIDLRNAEAKNSDEDATNDVQVRDIIEGVRTTLERRVNNLGVSEPQIYTSTVAGEEHIIVELAGIKDIEEAKRIVGKTIQLEFKEPKTEADPGEVDRIKREADQTLQKALKPKADFEVIGENAKTTDGKIKFRSDQKKFVSELPPRYQELFKKLIPGKVSEKPMEDTEVTLDALTGNLVEKNGLYIVQLQSKEIADQITTKYDAFRAIAGQVQSEWSEFKGRVQADFEALEWETLQSKEEGQYTDGIQIGEKVRVYKVLKKEAAENLKFDVERIEVDQGQTEALKEALKRVTEGYQVTQSADQFTYHEIVFDLTPDPWKSTGLDGSRFRFASVTYDQVGRPQVSIQFDSEGGKMFEELTGRLVNQRLAIFVGGELISAPNVNEKIPGGSAVITGNFSIQEALQLATDLNTGAIDAPIILSGQYTISATLGENALQVSLFAGLIGLVALTLFMLGYYRLLGVFAVLALTIYSIILLFIINVFPIVMTLAGIAGVILSIGMAVDANILIFERTREELNLGKNFTASVAAGFERAWSSIRDSNVSSLITCAILWFFGNSIIRGFALMLALGILVSMFTAITVTRAFLQTLSGTGISKNRWLLGAKKIEILNQ